MFCNSIACNLAWVWPACSGKLQGKISIWLKLEWLVAGYSTQTRVVHYSRWRSTKHVWAVLQEMQALAPHENFSLMATTPKTFSAGNVAHDEIPAGLFGSNACPHKSMKPKLLPATMATESAPVTQPQNVSSLNCQLHSITVVYSSMEHGALHNTDKRFNLQFGFICSLQRRRSWSRHL